MWSALSVRGSRVPLSLVLVARVRVPLVVGSLARVDLSRLVRAARVDLSRLSRVALVRVVGSRSCAARGARSRGSLVRGRLMPLSFVLGSLSLSRVPLSWPSSACRSWLVVRVALVRVRSLSWLSCRSRSWSALVALSRSRVARGAALVPLVALWFVWRSLVRSRGSWSALVWFSFVVPLSFALVAHSALVWRSPSSARAALGSFSFSPKTRTRADRFGRLSLSLVQSLNTERNSALMARCNSGISRTRAL